MNIVRKPITENILVEKIMSYKLQGISKSSCKEVVRRMAYFLSTFDEKDISQFIRRRKNKMPNGLVIKRER